MIRISYVKLTNLLSFLDGTVVDNIQPISVLVGRNNSGKSNFIRCLEFYHSLSESSEIQDNISPTEIKEMRHKLAPFDGLSIEIRFDYKNTSLSKYPLEIEHLISFNKEGQFTRERLQFRRKHHDKILHVFTKEKNNGGYSASLQNSESVNAFLSDIATGKTESLENINLSAYKPFLWSATVNNSAMTIFVEIQKFVSKWIFIPGNRSIQKTDAGDSSLKSNGSNIEQYIGRQLQKAVKKTGRLVSNISNLIEINDLNLDNDGGKPYTLVSDMPGADVKLKYFGSGFEQIYILLPQLYEEYVDNTIFFIEEPEIHLHPLLQRKLLQYFIKRSKTNQFFITTHSTIFCRQHDGILQSYLVKKPGHRTQIESIRKERMDEIKLILGHVNTDLFNYNAVLFVEGESEERTLPLLARNLEFDLVDDGIRILNSKGYGNMRQLGNIIDLLKETGTEIYAMFDGHHRNQGKLKDVMNKVNKENLLELQKGFEDCFDYMILIEALSKLCSSFNCVFSNDELISIKEELASVNSFAFNVLNKYYYLKTNYPLSKVDFGEALARCIKEKNMIGSSVPEMFLERIHEQIDRKLNVEA